MSPLKPLPKLSFHPQIDTDFENLDSDALRQVAMNLVFDIAFGKIRGQRLEKLPAIGDLSDCHKIYFAETRFQNPNYRIIFRYFPNTHNPMEIEYIIIGKREDLFVYYEAIKRLGK